MLLSEIDPTLTDLAEAQQIQPGAMFHETQIAAEAGGVAVVDTPLNHQDLIKMDLSASSVRCVNVQDTQLPRAGIDLIMCTNVTLPNLVLSWHLHNNNLIINSIPILVPQATSQMTCSIST
jgi:hypothetical protein